MAGVKFQPSTAALPTGALVRHGKIDVAVKAIIQRESDILTKKQGVAEWLFNVEKAYHAEEAIVTETNFGLLSPVEDGGVKELMSKQESQANTIRHFEISGVFRALAAMLEDSVNVGGISSQLKQMARNLVASYYMSRNYIASGALSSGLSTTFSYKGRAKPNTCADGKALFAKDHTVGVDGDTQGNSFYSTRANGAGFDTSTANAIMAHAANKMRNFLDESGFPMGYTADTIVIPGNTPALEVALKTALASQSTSASSGAMSGDTNIQYDNWNLVILHTWQAAAEADCPMIFMSSEANRQLSGSMFYDRTPFLLKDWDDPMTSDYCIAGRARVSAGWGSYKHVLYHESLAYQDTSLTNGATASDAGTSVTL